MLATDHRTHPLFSPTTAYIEAILHAVGWAMHPLDSNPNLLRYTLSHDHSFDRSLRIYGYNHYTLDNTPCDTAYLLYLLLT